jgi:hypothetical protein
MDTLVVIIPGAIGFVALLLALGAYWGRDKD